MSKWTRKFVPIFHSFDQKGLLVCEAGSICSSVLLSRIKPPSSSMVVFAQRHFGPNNPVDFYYGTFVYTDLSKQRQISRTYVEALLEVTEDTFNTWAAEVDGKVTHKHGIEHNV